MIIQNFMLGGMFLSLGSKFSCTGNPKDVEDKELNSIEVDVFYSDNPDGSIESAKIYSSLVKKLHQGLLIEITLNSIGKSGKVDVPKKYIGKRTYVVIMKD